MVVFHANIRTMGRRQNADRFHKGSSVVIHISRMKRGLKNAIKCQHIPFSVLNVRLWSVNHAVTDRARIAWSKTHFWLDNLGIAASRTL